MFNEIEYKEEGKIILMLVGRLCEGNWSIWFVYLENVRIDIYFDSN